MTFTYSGRRLKRQWWNGGWNPQTQIDSDRLRLDQDRLRMDADKLRLDQDRAWAWGK